MTSRASHRTIGPARARDGRVRPALVLGLLALLLTPILFLRLTTSRQPARRPLPSQAGPTPTADATEPTVPEQPTGTSPARSSVVEASQGAPTPAAAPGEMATPSSALDLTVLWDDGTPVSDATVAITSAEEVLEHGQTETDGRLRLDPISVAEAEVFVVQGALLVARVPLATPSGAVQIEVPLLRSVNGIVRVEGHTPLEPLILRLETSEMASAPRLPPPFVQAVLGWRSRSNSSPSTRTEAEGGFTLGGLAEDWSGDLVPEWPYRFLSGEESLALDGPISNLVVDLDIPPSIRGRVLSPSGAPVPHCRISAHLESPRGHSTFLSQTGENGHFLLPLQNGGARSADIDFVASGTGRAAVEVPLIPSTGIDVGDVSLLAGRTLVFHVVDNHGVPAPHAIARDSMRVGSPSGEDGICTIESVSLEMVTIEIEALSCRSVEVNVSASSMGPAQYGTPEDPIEVVLPRDASLEVVFRDAAGEPVPGLNLLLEGPEVFTRKGGGADWRQSQLGASSIFRSSMTYGEDGEKLFSAGYRSGSSNRVFVTGLRSGVPIQVAAQDSIEMEAGWSDTIVLEPEEARRIEVTIEGKPSTLRGRVLAQDGSPVPHAAISILELQGNSHGLETDSEGAFEIGPVYRDTLSLCIRPSTFAARILHGVPTAQPVEIRLDRGRRMLVTVLDSTGVRHRPAFVVASQEDIDISQGIEQDDGRFLFEHLPFGPVEIQALLGNTWFSTPAGNGAETTVSIPEPGSVLARLNQTLPARAEVSLWLVDVADNSEGRRHRMTPEELASGQATFPVVFPGTYIVRGMAQGNDVEPQSASSLEFQIRAGESAEVILKN